MIQLPTKEQCCGCMGCKTICPQNAISLSKDEKGFIYPKVDPDLCVDCGVCMERCCFPEKNGQEQEAKSTWAYRIRDKQILDDSTSGGAFTALSDLILDNGGVVAGCIIDENFTAFHTITAEKTVRDQMRRSKYVQSNTDGIFQSVRQELQRGRQVLFIGTPCQAAQMAGYAENERDRLIVCDFLCHGVPNNDFFKEHIRYLEEAYGCKAIKYFFRGKKYGWNHMLEEVVLDGGNVRGDKKVQAYSRFFYSGVSLRPSCRSCRYRSIERSSDITIGDFWGIEKLLGKTDNRGYSLVMANTQRGQKLVEQMRLSGELIRAEKEAVAFRLCEPLSPSKIDEKAFWESYDKDGYVALVSRYTDTSNKAALIHRVKKTVKRILSRL